MKCHLILVVSGLVVTLINALPQGQGDYRGNFAPISATTPVPILQQIDTHNEDGSYTYGYEGGDGSYKIETKSVTGEVRGKYGYYDDQGKLREIEYGATKMGFVPMGTDIAPPPPHVQQQLQQRTQGSRFEQQSLNPRTQETEDDGSYRPAEYEIPYDYQPHLLNHQPQQPQGIQPFQHLQHHHQQFPVSKQERQRQRQIMRQLQQFNVDTLGRRNYDQQNTFQGHPATNVNLNSGAYSITY